jgi:hypothetical protein
VMIIAEAQSAEGWALAAGAVVLLVLASGCVYDGHRACVCWKPGATPPAFCKLFRISGFAGFRLYFPADKGFRSSPHGAGCLKRDLFRASFIIFEFAEWDKWRCHKWWVWKSYALFCGARKDGQSWAARP